ncbi:hypothetical protein [Paraburkholderia acidicola]|uniref:hypothetical protein n=1 Tax=Paraburkholderia acidicola TaxID=1912599 RepID=UPI00105643AE|nr:hypothetical protein [Paraburkholderia acidicola]
MEYEDEVTDEPQMHAAIDVRFSNRGTTMRNIVQSKTTLLLLALISASAGAQTVYDARQQLFGVITDQACAVYAEVGGAVAKANAKGTKRATVKARASRAVGADGRPLTQNPDALNLTFAIIDAVYEQGAKTDEEGNVIGRQICTQTMAIGE